MNFEKNRRTNNPKFKESKSRVESVFTDENNLSKMIGNFKSENIDMNNKYFYNKQKNGEERRVRLFLNFYTFTSISIHKSHTIIFTYFHFTNNPCAFTNIFINYYNVFRLWTSQT